MLIAVGSVKGSPGATSTALGLAAIWPRPVVLLEADPAGGDLAYRCNGAHGGPLAPHKGLLKLVAAVRTGTPRADCIENQAERLACGVDVVQGVSSAAQGRGIASLWPMVSAACAVADHDVIADVGRIDGKSSVMALAHEAEALLAITTASLGPVLQLTNGLHDIVASLAGPPMVPVNPILVGPDSHADRDCADLDDLLHRAGLPTAAVRGLAYDPKALERLEAGEHVDRRLSRTLLVRGLRKVAAGLVQTYEVRP